MVRHRRLGALALIGIAIIGLLYHLQHAQTETNEPTRSSSAPNSPGQRKSASKSAGKSAGRPPSRPVKSKVGCVNYGEFTANLSFDPSTVVPPDTVFRSLKRLLFFIGHARSGSSMLGRLLDAHPHMTISHEVHSCVYLHFASNFYYYIVIILLLLVLISLSSRPFMNGRAGLCPHVFLN